MQHGQVFAKGHGSGDATNWAYRYRLGGRDSKRVQRSGFPTETAAAQALDRALERARQEQGPVETPTLNELVEMYLAQHETEPETIEKLRWKASPTDNDHASNSTRSNPGTNSRLSRTGSDGGSGRWSCSPPQPG
jgi:hypothetical protein